MAFFAVVTLLCYAIGAYGLEEAKQPNIVFILTDDQDVHMKSVEYMPALQQYIASQGTTYTRHYCSTALCCPARATIWTGKATHNTNVTDVAPPYGGYPKVVATGINDWYLPIWMQNAGYNTYYSGKLWNYLNEENYNQPFVKGFNGSELLLEPWTYQYFNASMTRNGADPVSYEGQYSVDVVADKAYGFLEEAINHTQPFFLVAAPVACHSRVIYNTTGADTIMPQYAAKYADYFTNYTIPRDPSFNPPTPGGANYIAELPLLDDNAIAIGDEYQRARLRSLQSVDDMIEGLVTRLDNMGILNDTYIIYTTDNGFHISQHRMLPGKTCGYETDINVPLLVRGPGVAKNKTSVTISNHQDLGPTIMSLAGQQNGDFDFDGVPLPLYDGFTNSTKQENVDVEYWGPVYVEGNLSYPGNIKESIAENPNTYKSVRVIGANYSLYYSIWCTNEKEYYNMETDPYQLTNLLANGTTSSAISINGRPSSAVLDRVDALLMVLKTCKGGYCTQPWDKLHPQDDVHSLADALNPEYDEFYASQPKVSFTACSFGYIETDEGPQNVNVYSDNATTTVPSRF